MTLLGTSLYQGHTDAWELQTLQARMAEGGVR